MKSMKATSIKIVVFAAVMIILGGLLGGPSVGFLVGLTGGLLVLLLEGTLWFVLPMMLVVTVILAGASLVWLGWMKVRPT